MESGIKILVSVLNKKKQKQNNLKEAAPKKIKIILIVKLHDNIKFIPDFATRLTNCSIIFLLFAIWTIF